MTAGPSRGRVPAPRLPHAGASLSWCAMRHRFLAVLTLLSILAMSALAACGDSDEGKPRATAPPGSPEERAKAQLTAFFDLVKKGGGAPAAGFIAYRGKDETRRYKAAVSYTTDEDRRLVDRVVARVQSALQAGEPVFTTSEHRTQGSESWTAWKVRFGEGAKSKEVLFAFVDAKGTMLLGDVDG